MSRFPTQEFINKAFASITKAWPYLANHAAHIDGEFENAVSDLRRAVEVLKEKAHPLPRVYARITGVTVIEFVREPGHDGRDQPDATWSVGKRTVLFEDDDTAHSVVCKDWFQVDGPDRTVYVFEKVAE